MPLLKGHSKGIISENIREMRAAGHPEAQAVAAALHNADKSKRGGDPPKHKSKTRTIGPSKPGQKAIKFHEGGLHASTGTKSGKKISPAKHAAAASGKLGPKAQKQEQFYRNVLKH
jgi:hypothetical protein